MSNFWIILWEIIKYSTLIGCVVLFITFLIALFHPIYLTLKGRASLLGQRGEIILSYLFGLLRLRCIATVHTQDVWLEFGWFKKLLQRESVVNKKENNKVEDKDGISDYIEEKEISDNNVIDDGIESNNESKNEFEHNESIEKPSGELLEEKKEIEENIENKEIVNDSAAAEEEDLDKEIVELETKNNQKEEIESLSSEIESNESQDIDEENYPKVEVTQEQLAELQSILEEEENKKEQQSKKGNSWEAKLRKFKKDFNRRYEQIKSKLRLLKQKWNSLWPVAKRFWNRGKKGFEFHDCSLKLEYSLEEHYLTGMLCGYLAPTIGFAKRYGLNFEPVAVFPNKPSYGVYTKLLWYLDIKPYRLVWAMLGLLFEKNIYKEIYWLYKFKKGKK